MTLDSVFAFVAALVLFALMPGPSNILIVGRALAGGFRAAINLILGMLLGDLFYMALVFFGLAALGFVLGEFFVIVRVLAALYLVYLGLTFWRKRPDAPHLQNAGTGNAARDFLTGFGLTLGNPKAILFHLGFLPVFFDLPKLGVLDALAIMGLFTIVLGTAFALYAFAAGRAGGFFRSAKRMRLVNRISGTLLIGAGVTVLARQG